MAQNEKVFIDSICKVFNTLSSLGLKFKCTAKSNQIEGDEESGINNNYIHLTIDPKKPGEKEFYITVGSNEKVLLTFDSKNTNFSTTPQILSKSSSYAGMKRITYGNKSIENIEEDIKKI